VAEIGARVAANDLPSILSRVIEIKAEYDIRLLAQQLGTKYRSLIYWLRGERQLPADLLPRMCVLLRNYEALDFLESQAGRVAFKLPDPDITLERELVAVSHLIMKVGRLWRALRKPSPTALLNKASCGLQFQSLKP
jgi:hypothetical protein